MSQRRMQTPLSVLFPLIAGVVSMRFGVALLATAGSVSLWHSIANRLNSPLERPFLSIVTIPAGLTPSEVEREITTRIEQSIADLPGVAEVRSISTRELSVVRVHGKSTLVLPTLRRSLEARLDKLSNSTAWPHGALHGPWLLAAGSSLRSQAPALHDSRSRFGRALLSIGEWCRKQLHQKIAEQHRHLVQALRGHYSYFGITGNANALSRFFYEAPLAKVCVYGGQSRRIWA